jgi:hypothetical protein
VLSAKKVTAKDQKMGKVILGGSGEICTLLTVEISLTNSLFFCVVCVLSVSGHPITEPEQTL